MRLLLPILLAATLAIAQETSKPPLVAVVPLAAQGVDGNSALVVTDALSNELLKTGLVRVMERSQMEAILKEQGFQQSGACDGSECVVEMGRILSIDRMVVGSLGQLGESYTLSARIVDVATGEVMGSAQHMRKGAIDDVIADLLPRVVQDLSETRDKSPSALATRPAAPPLPPPPPTSPATAAAALPSEPAARPAATNLEQSRPSRAWIWWTAGGLALAGGGAAAVLLLSSDTDDPAPVDPNPAAIDAIWKPK